MDVAGISDEGMAVLALTENERRKELSQIEVVRAHYKAIDETALTIQTLADQFGIDRSTLSNHLRVLDLPDFVLQHVESREAQRQRGQGVPGVPDRHPPAHRGYGRSYPEDRQRRNATEEAFPIGVDATCGKWSPRR